MRSTQHIDQVARQGGDLGDLRDAAPAEQISGCKISTAACVTNLRKPISRVNSASHRELEVIVVDDGSTDGTENTVKDYADQGRITYIKRENGGIAAARNTGLSACTGDYLSLM